MATTTAHGQILAFFIDDVEVSRYTYLNGKVVATPIVVGGSLPFNDWIPFIASISTFVENVKRNVATQELDGAPLFGLETELKVKDDQVQLKIEIEDLAISIVYGISTGFITFNSRPPFNIGWSSFMQYYNGLRFFVELVMRHR